MLKIETLKSYLDQKPTSLKVVSFDIFDTLLIRMIPPVRVMQIAAEKLCELLGQPNLSSNVFKSRLEFKKKMDAAYAFGEAEWTVSEWLEKLPEELGIRSEHLDVLGRQAELEAEQISLRLSEHAREALSFVENKGLRAIAISDMWLEQSWLVELLQKFDLRFTDVFSSSTLKVSKRRGTIFPVIEKEIKLESDAFLHIGDSLKADWLRPRLAGWKSLWMPRDSKLYTQVMPNRLKITLLKPKNHHDIVQALHIPSLNSSDPYYDLAYNDVARLLIIFALVQWRRFISQKIDVVFYIARDARCMLDVYDLISDLLPGSCPRRYIRLSRKAVALVHPANYLISAQPLAGKVGRKTVAEWLSNFMLKNQLVDHILKRAGLTGDVPFSDQSRIALKATCQNLKPDIEQAQAELRQMLRKFLQQKARRTSPDRIGIVDSGWACTIQDTIRHVLDKKQLVSGMYLGVSHQGLTPDESNQKYGLIRDDFRHPPHYNPMEATAGVVRLWDTLLREPAGTVQKLIAADNGQIDTILKTPKQMGKLERQAAVSIRDGIRQGTVGRRRGIRLLAQIIEHFSESDFEQAATEIARKITTRPSRRTATAILSLGFDEGTAKEEGGTIGFGGIKEGVSWYSGLLAKSGFRFFAPVLETLADLFYQSKMRKR